MKTKILLILFFNTLLLGETMIPICPVLPQPQQFQYLDHKHNLNKKIQMTSFFAGDADEFISVLSKAYNIVISETRSDADIIVTQPNRSEIQPLLDKYHLQFEQKMRDEGYLLIIEQDQIAVIAETKTGAFYGMMSLGQLLDHFHDNKVLPCLWIKDWPDLKFRGITDDMSRGQVSTMENLKNIVRFLADHKMNVYMPYIEDIFQFKNYPNIGNNRGALTAQECRDLQSFAAQYHVEIIPIFQTLGHYENILLQKEFIHLADFPGAASLNTVSEQTYEFLETVLAEIVPVFESVYFHIGADESWDVGKGASRAKSKRHGIATVHADHYRRVYDILQKYDKKIMMYGDIILSHPGILNEIPQDLIMFDWHYNVSTHYPSTETFAKAGQPFIVSAGTHNWRHIFPIMPYALANIYHLTLNGIQNGAQGSIVSNWGDYGGANLREFNYLPYAYNGAVSWNCKAADIDTFEQLFFNRFFGTADPRISAIYQLLSEMSKSYEVLHFFANPFFPLHDKQSAVLYRAISFPAQSKTVNSLIDTVEPSIAKNKEHLQLLRLCADWFDWIGRMSQVRTDIDHAATFAEKTRDQELDRIDLALSGLSIDLKKLKTDYEKAWLYSNRPENLFRITGLMDRLGILITVKQDQIRKGVAVLDGKMPAPFISHPKKENSAVPQIYTRKTFQLQQKPKKAWLQLIADSDAIIYVNGKKAGSIMARKSLSAWVESERVKAWQIAGLLSKGKNTIAVKVKNYQENGVASANIWLECMDLDLVISGSDSWLINTRQQTGWFEKDFDDRDWALSVPHEKKWLISRPFFQYDLPSRIEFFQYRY